MGSTILDEKIINCPREKSTAFERWREDEKLNNGKERNW